MLSPLHPVPTSPVAFVVTLRIAQWETQGPCPTPALHKLAGPLACIVLHKSVAAAGDTQLSQRYHSLHL